MLNAMLIIGEYENDSSHMCTYLYEPIKII